VRGTGAVETDYINGEIVLIGRLTGVPTPVNALLQRLARETVRDRHSPGWLAPAEVLARLDDPSPAARRKLSQMS
jgi:2-dehydropantoate 2-reductase